MWNKCIEEGCNSEPCFGVKGGKRRFCVKHKAAEMVNLKGKKCEEVLTPFD
jgi:hypothetical protein